MKGPPERFFPACTVFTSQAPYGDIAGLPWARGLVAPKAVLDTSPCRGEFIAAMPRSAALQLPVKILPVELSAQPWQFAIFTPKEPNREPGSRSIHAHVRDFARGRRRFPGRRAARSAGHAP